MTGSTPRDNLQALKDLDDEAGASPKVKVSGVALLHDPNAMADKAKQMRDDALNFDPNDAAKKAKEAGKHAVEKLGHLDEDALRKAQEMKEKAKEMLHLDPDHNPAEMLRKAQAEMRNMTAKDASHKLVAGVTGGADKLLAGGLAAGFAGFGELKKTPDRLHAYALFVIGIPVTWISAWIVCYFMVGLANMSVRDRFY